jgi:hypothetical protein
MSGGGHLRTVERTLERTAGVQEASASAGGRRPAYSSGVTIGCGRLSLLGWTPRSSWWTPCIGQAVDTAGAGRPSMHPGVSCTSVDDCGHGRRWRSWTWLSGAVSAVDTAVRTLGRITAVWPAARTAAVRPASDGGHELGRRVRAVLARRMLFRRHTSGPIPTTLLSAGDRQGPMVGDEEGPAGTNAVRAAQG